MTDEEYYEFIQPYEDAKQMILTRLDVLNHNLYGEASARPIHNIQCRIKKKQSIEEKLPHQNPSGFPDKTDEAGICKMHRLQTMPEQSVE